MGIFHPALIFCFYFNIIWRNYRFNYSYDVNNSISILLATTCRINWFIAFSSDLMLLIFFMFLRPLPALSSAFSFRFRIYVMMFPCGRNFEKFENFLFISKHFLCWNIVVFNIVAWHALRHARWFTFSFWSKGVEIL